MKIVPKMLSQSELGDILELGSESMRKLRKEGLPSTKVNRKLMFSPQSCFDWFVQKGKHKHATSIAGACKLDSVNQKAASNTGDIADLDAYIERVRFNECALHQFVKGSAGSKEGLVWAIANYKDACKQRLDVEKEISKIKLEQSRTIPADVAERKIVEMAQTIRSHLLSLSSKVAPMLEGKSKSAIKDLLSSEIHNLLQDFANDRI